jgi:hypothetical protein
MGHIYLTHFEIMPAGFDPTACYRVCSGITDTFNRPDQVGLGTSDAGIEWALSSDGYAKIVSGEAWIGQYGGSSSDNFSTQAMLPMELPLPLHFSIDIDPLDYDPNSYVAWFFDDEYGSNWEARVSVSYNWGGGVYWLSVDMLLGDDSVNGHASVSVVGGTMYQLVVDFDGSTIVATMNGVTVETSSGSHYASSCRNLTVGGSTGGGAGDLAHFDNLDITGVNSCVDVMPGGSGVSTGSTAVVGNNVNDTLVPLDSPTVIGGSTVYPSGSQWRTTKATYLPGSSRLAVNGLYRFGDYIETDPDNGVVTINFNIYAGTDQVILNYITNGRLP